MDTFLDLAWRIALLILAPLLVWRAFRGPTRREQLRRIILARLKER